MEPQKMRKWLANGALPLMSEQLKEETLAAFDKLVVDAARFDAFRKIACETDAEKRAAIEERVTPALDLMLDGVTEMSPENFNQFVDSLLAVAGVSCK